MFALIFLWQCIIWMLVCLYLFKGFLPLFYYHLCMDCREPRQASDATFVFVSLLYASESNLISFGVAFWLALKRFRHWKACFVETTSKESAPKDLAVYKNLKRKYLSNSPFVSTADQAVQTYRKKLARVLHLVIHGLQNYCHIYLCKGRHQL